MTIHMPQKHNGHFSFQDGNQKAVGTRAPAFRKALESHLENQAQTQKRLVQATYKGKDVDFDALSSLKLDALRAKFGSRWDKAAEERVAGKLKRFGAAGDREGFIKDTVGDFVSRELLAIPAGSALAQTREGAIQVSYIDFSSAGYGTYYYYDTYATGEGRIFYCGPLMGLGQSIGAQFLAANTNTDDSDQLYASAEGGVWFSFTPPKSGRLNIWLEGYVLTDSRYRLRHDEWGFSNSVVNQKREFVIGSFDGDNPIGRAYLRYPGTKLGTTDYYSGNGSDYVGQEYTVANPGDVLRFGGQIGASVFKGKPIDILVGVRVYVSAWMNDVSITAHEAVEFRLSHAWISID